MHRLFRCCDRSDPGFGETMHPRPRVVSDTVLVRSHIHHVAAALWVGHLVVALLVGEDDQAIALAVDLGDGLAEIGPAVRLRVDDRVAQREAAAGRGLYEPVAEREELHPLAD